MSLVANEVTEADYLGVEIRDLLERGEGFRVDAYIDTRGFVTNGLGFNIEQQANLLEITLNTFGFVLDPNEDYSQADLDRESAYATRIRTIISNAVTEADLVELDQIMYERSTNNAYDSALIDRSRSTF